MPVRLMRLNAHDIGNNLLLDRLVLRTQVVVPHLNRLHLKRVVLSHQLVFHHLHQQIDSLRWGHVPYFPLVTDRVGVVPNEDHAPSPDPVDDLVDSRALTTIGIVAMLVLVHLHNHTMTGQIEEDVRTAITAPLEHTGRIVSEFRVYATAQMGYHRPLFLVAANTAVGANILGRFPDIAVLAEPFQRVFVFFRGRVGKTVLASSLWDEERVFFSAIGDGALVFEDEMDHPWYFVGFTPMGAFVWESVVGNVFTWGVLCIGVVMG